MTGKTAVTSETIATTGMSDKIKSVLPFIEAKRFFVAMLFILVLMRGSSFLLHSFPFLKKPEQGNFFALFSVKKSESKSPQYDRKEKTMKIKLLSLLLALSLITVGCVHSSFETKDPLIGGDLKSRDLVSTEESNKTASQIAKDPLPLYTLSEEAYNAYMAFTVGLLQECVDPEQSKNVMISPLSVMTALAMTGEGAKGSTLSQLEQGLGLDREALGAFLSAYLPSLPVGEGYKLTPANSIWMRDTDALQVKEDFLDTCARLYDASVHREAFDKSTVDKINDWVSDNTDSMIKQTLDEIPPDAVLYLINALAFDSLWKEEYKEHQVRKATFTDRTGEIQEVDMMYSSEGLYLQSEDALGFVRFYRDQQYAFVGILPGESLSVDQYLASLTPEKLTELLSSVCYGEVYAGLPKFTSEYSTELSKPLQNLGITDLFNSGSCDLTDMATCDLGNLFVSRVLHKTFIDVNEEGTRAAAVTAVTVETDCEPMDPPINVILDRPFVYMILDWENRLPIFIGTTETFAD